MGETGNQTEDVGAQAAHWYARLKTLPVSRETLEEFFLWRRTADHAEAFDAVDRVYSGAGTAAYMPSVIAATQAAYDRGPTRRRQLRVSRAKWLSVAAALLIVTSSGLFLGWPRGSAYHTHIGEQSAVLLDDGSKVQLDTDTELIVRFSAHARYASLDHGQAYFTVAHDPSRPFTVNANGTDVVATGTQFDVRRFSSGVDVTLVEGSVRVSPQGQNSTRLSSGQAVSVRPGRTSEVRTVDTASATAWTRGQIVLDGVTLADAIAEVNRYTTKPVRLDADHLAGERFGGSFEAGDRASFVAAATALLPLRAITDPDGSIRLVDAGAAPHKKLASTL